MEPTETEERGPELKIEPKEEEDQPSTSATQSSPAPGQSKKKSKSLKLCIPGGRKRNKRHTVEWSQASWASEIDCNVISLSLQPLAWSLHYY